VIAAPIPIVRLPRRSTASSSSTATPCQLDEGVHAAGCLAALDFTQQGW
jgi:hypothetical protein